MMCRFVCISGGDVVVCVLVVCKYKDNLVVEQKKYRWLVNVEVQYVVCVASSGGFSLSLWGGEMAFVFGGCEKEKSVSGYWVPYSRFFLC